MHEGTGRRREAGNCDDKDGVIVRSNVFRRSFVEVALSPFLSPEIVEVAV